MKREDAIFFWNVPRRNNNCDETIDTAIAALRGPVPDPETGLVRCGCGGKAVLHDENKVSCNKCGITTLEQFTQDDARNDWNTAMGWRGK